MQLKHLQFVRIIAINTAVIVSNLYDYAKQNSGPLKSAVETVENAVTAVVCPVYEKFRGFPGDLLVFLDKKLDEGTYKFDEYAPPLAKKVVSKTQSLVKKASQIAYDLAEETKVGGPGAALSLAGTMSKHFAMSHLAIVWYKVDHYPALHGLTEMAVLTAAYFSEKYNKLVKDLTAKGYSVFGYLPLVPIEEMANAYKKVETAAAKKEDASSSSEEMAKAYKKVETAAAKKEDASSSSESELDKE
ncbi:REF SRPP At1g67360 [Olea europaea subsp. europaea]|uniref:REF SRPP At1g67360 n=2 Tax=Olea europaea subsp. europaea TaxID=158383 RepID=A0A8S0RB04_OLEEU|nr:REF SRPP At1g67360 [Olea europaea subsp. europaea]